MNRTLLCAAITLGACIAYVDSRPGWDATGITAFSMLISGGIFGFIGPQRPWLWALGIGAWLPLHAMAVNPSLGAALMLVVLLFPLAGAYAGKALRALVLPPAGQR
jgi:hypothetical protein